MRKIVIFILIIGILIGIAGIYYYRKNIYSKDILKLEILGQDQAQAFDEIEYVVKYKNNGDTALQSPQLTFQYPENSIPSDGGPQAVTKTLDDIYPGEEKTISFKARLYGKENDTETAKASLRYQPKNLKAFYESDTTFTTRINFVPLTFEIDLPSKVETGKDIQFFLNYFSNSDWPLSNLAIKIEYPSGFEFSDSNPKALEKTEWDLPLLNKTEGGRIEVDGKLSGNLKDQEIFKASLGMWQNGQFILLKEADKGAEIAETSISVFQQINGSSNYVANPGDLLHYEIFFRNMSTAPYQNLFLVSKLDSTAFDFSSIKMSSGQFNQGDNSLVWDWRDIPKLRFLDVGEEGEVEFWINLKNNWDTNSFQDKNFSLKNNVSLLQTNEEFDTKINSQLEISQQGFFQDEIFGNTGPIPPQAGKSTTYTITWQVKNSYNDVKNVTVRATLLSNVKLTGKIFPEDSHLTFDSQSREIVWSVGDLSAGTGFINSVPNISFQISLTPDSYQIGQTPRLIGQATVSGEDDWTGETLQAKSSEINTTLPDDSTSGGAVH